jgi:sugar phosphate isomerase/epimerase
MFKNLSPGAIGIRGLSLAEQIDLAAQTGFGGIDFSIREAAELADEKGIAYVKALFADAGVRPGQWGLPVAWNQADDQYEQELAALPKLAAVGRELGCTRTATWCLSGSNEREYDENFDWHVARFRPIAQALAAEDCRLGIEFLGPKTIRDRFEHTFIYTLGGMMELAHAIGDNVGLLLDAWHLYTSGDSLDVLDTISALDIVTVHVNDAPEGLTLETYVDNDRRLPMETNVIDLGGFMNKLAALAYDGPVTPEPFSARVNAIEDPLEAAQLVAEHMDMLWAAGGFA